VTELFLLVLGQKPTAEQSRWPITFKVRKGQKTATRTSCGLINSKAFIFNGNCCRPLVNVPTDVDRLAQIGQKLPLFGLFSVPAPLHPAHAKVSGVFSFARQ